MSHPAEHESTGPTRRTVLAAVGLAGVGAAALAGCGADEAVSDAVDSATSSAKDAVGKAIDKASIPVGGGTILAEQKIVVTQPTAGDFKAFSAVCPHQGCIVSKVADGTITCGSPCGHGSTYDAATGKNTGGPATRGLTEKKVTIGADGITVT
jgi:Rieske Fe-S protein